MQALRKIHKAWLCKVLALIFANVGYTSVEASTMRYEVAGPSDIRPFDLDEHFRPSSVYHKDAETGQLVDANNQAVNLPPWSPTDQNWVLAWNRSGSIVGESYLDANNRVGFLYQNGTMTYTDPKVVGLEQSSTAINDSGQIVGGGHFGGSYLIDHGLKRSLDGLPGSIFTIQSTIATDINNSGVIVGNTASCPSYAFVYLNEKMMDLSQVTSGINGWGIDKAYAVTDDGWILAESWDKQMNGSKNSIWLKPLENTDSSSSASSGATTQPDPPSTIVDTTSGGFWTTSTQTTSLNDTAASATPTTTVTPAPVPVPEPATYLIWAGLATILYMKASR